MSGAASTATAPFLADFERVFASLPGEGTRPMRRAALGRFARAGLPTRRDEAWKYTSVAPLAEREFTAAPGPASLRAGDDLDPLVFGDLGGHRLVFVNGRFAPPLSSIGKLPDGVGLSTLAGTLERDCACLDGYLGEARHATAFASLNAAFMTDGLHLHLARGAAVEEPIHALFLASGEGHAIHPRNVIVAEPGSRATVIEHYAATDGAANFTNAVTRIHAGEGASIRHYRLQQEADAALHVGAVLATQSRESRLASHSVALGAALARVDIATAFEGEGCEAALDGLYLARGTQHVDHHTRIDHAMPHGTSRELYRGILEASGRGVFHGQVVVHPGARGTDAGQANHNLLLSREAEVDTRPQLEIHADDVKCTHGATVGRLDPLQLFYLRSRGMDEAGARSLLTLAFARDVIARIRVDSLRDRLERILSERLAQGGAA